VLDIRRRILWLFDRNYVQAASLEHLQAVTSGE
jgi:hypothetical protein